MIKLIVSFFVLSFISFLKAEVVAYYPFSGNANDFTGNENNGIIYGATLTSDRFSNPNKAYFFESSDYIAVPTPNSIQFSTKDFSISVWVNYSSVSSENQVIVEQNCGTGGWAMGIEKNTTQLFWTQRGVKGEKCGEVSPGMWHHLVVTRNSDSMFFYIDNLLASQKIFNNANYNNYDIYIGANLCDSDKKDFLKGKIDDIYIYDQILTRSEISDLYGHNVINLLNPSSGSKNVPLNPELKWTSMLLAESYRVQLFVVSVTGDSGLTKDVVGIEDTTLKLTGLKENSLYYWKVCAINTEGVGTWSDMSNFKTVSNVHITPISNNLISNNLISNNFYDMKGRIASINKNCIRLVKINGLVQKVILIK